MSTTLEKGIDIPSVVSRHPLDNLLKRISMARDPFIYMKRLYREYGEIVRAPGLMTETIFAFSPDLAHEVLSNTTVFYNGGPDEVPDLIRVPDDSAIRRMFKTLNVINGEKHRQQRRLMMPSFHRKRVEGYIEEMSEQIERKLKQWQPGQKRDMLQEMRQITMAVAVKTLLGLDPEKEGEETRRLVDSWIRMADNPVALLLPYEIPGLPFNRLVKTAGSIEKVFQDLIDRKRTGEGEGRDVLATLIEAHDEDGNRLSDEELVAQTLTLFVAGHETTAIAMTWTLFLLAQHPYVAFDLLEELNTKLNGRTPTAGELNDLPMLDRVYKESMRVMSSFLWALRVAQNDYQIGQYPIAKGDMVLVSPAIIHHMPELYPEPGRFRPERWLNIEPGPYEFMPFAAGPRMCIGATFAQMEMKLMLAMLLPRFRLSLVAGQMVNRRGVILSYPEGGMPMQLHQQDGRFDKVPVRGNIHKLLDL